MSSPPLPLSQPGGKGEAEGQVPVHIPGKPHPDPAWASAGPCPLQSLPLWRVGNVRFWEGSGSQRHLSHLSPSWGQSLTFLAFFDSPCFPPSLISSSYITLSLFLVFSLPSLLIKLLPFFLNLFSLSVFFLPASFVPLPRPDEFFFLLASLFLCFSER